jgi:putative transposase
MRNILGLPLADPFSDSLGRLNGQGPGLFYVANYPPKVGLSELVNSLLSADEAGIPCDCSVLQRSQERGSPVWSASYFVGSVGGAPITILRQYIEGQNRPSARCALSPGP